MTTYGIVPEGFTKKTLPDIIAELQDEYKTIYGNPNLADDSIIGQRIGVQAKLLADIWEVLEDLYNAPWPETSSGSALDSVLSLSGLVRKPATNTSVICQVTGTTGAIIPAGSQVANTKGDIFSLETAIEIAAGVGEGTFIAVETGTILAVEGTVEEIVTPVSGWDTVTNAIAGIIGNDIETDAEARVRRAMSLSVSGSGTLEAIQARILDGIDTVTGCSVFENRTDDEDAYSRPPHSFEAVVSGDETTEEDTAIAEIIWQIKPAGIETYGNHSAVVVDSNGDNQTIYFSRPVLKYVWVSIYTVSYTEETLPTDYKQQIIDAVYEYGLTLTIGKDLIVQRWMAQAIDIQGIGEVYVMHAVTDTEGGTPTFVDVNLAIGPTAIATMSKARIGVSDL